MYKKMCYIFQQFRCYVCYGVLAMFNFSARHICEGRKLFGEISIQAFYLLGLQNLSAWQIFSLLFNIAVITIV